MCLLVCVCVCTCVLKKISKIICINSFFFEILSLPLCVCVCVSLYVHLRTCMCMYDTYMRACMRVSVHLYMCDFIVFVCLCVNEDMKWYFISYLIRHHHLFRESVEGRCANILRPRETALDSTPLLTMHVKRLKTSQVCSVSASQVQVSDPWNSTRTIGPTCIIKKIIRRALTPLWAPPATRLVTGYPFSLY